MHDVARLLQVRLLSRLSREPGARARLRRADFFLAQAKALLPPALVLLLGVPARIAIGSDVLIAGVMKLFGGGAYAVKRAVHWPTVLRLLGGSVSGGVAGVGVVRGGPP